MSRQARQKSESGYLHVIVRGIGRQTLFEAREDYLFYLSILKRYCRETDISVLVYCLMENHVHLLVYDKNGSISQLMKKIGVSYSGYFNRKYDRTGHLFQDRYLSEPVEDERYLLTVARYILNNPVKAGLGPASRYPWSSYIQYGQADSFVDSSMLCELIGDRQRLDAFLSAENDDVCLEYTTRKRDDEWAKEVIRHCLGVENGVVLQNYERRERDSALRQLKAERLSIRQIERLTGLSRGIVQKA